MTPEQKNYYNYLRSQRLKNIQKKKRKVFIKKPVISKEQQYSNYLWKKLSQTYPDKNDVFYGSSGDHLALMMEPSTKRVSMVSGVQEAWVADGVTKQLQQDTQNASGEFRQPSKNVNSENQFFAQTAGLIENLGIDIDANRAANIAYQYIYPQKRMPLRKRRNKR